MPEIPFVAKLYIDDDREILKYSCDFPGAKISSALTVKLFSHEEIQIDSPSQTNILPFKFSVGGARCDVFNYRRNLPHQSARGISVELPQTVAEASTSTASHHLPAPTEIPAPSTTAFKSATKKAYERDTELNGGLPDPSIIQDSLQASPVKVKRKSAFELALEHETKNGEKWCTSENHLEPVHPRYLLCSKARPNRLTLRSGWKFQASSVWPE